MGEIISTKLLSNNKIKIRLLVSSEEALSLKNAIQNITLFCDNLFLEKANIIVRGNKGVTKFFKIPFSLRIRTKCFDSLYYQRLELEDKVYYVYTLKKERFL